jgi:hypothetical protein
MATAPTPGLVSFSVELEDTSPLAVTAAVSNSLGIAQVTLTSASSPPITLTAPSTYQVADLDVSDHLTYPGGFVSVLWTNAYPDPDETVSKLYTYHPYALTPNNKTLLSWAPYRGSGFTGYQIERAASPGVSPSSIGFSAYPVFIDESELANELYSGMIRYNVTVLSTAASPAAEVYGTSSTINSDLISTYRTGQDYCLITGTILQANGTSDSTQVISAFVHDGDTPMYLTPDFFAVYNEVTVPVNNIGQFAIPLVRGVLVTIHAPVMGYVKRFVVPDQAHANLTDITGLSLETEFFRGE